MCSLSISFDLNDFGLFTIFWAKEKGAQVRFCAKPYNFNLFSFLFCSVFFFIFYVDKMGAGGDYSSYKNIST